MRPIDKVNNSENIKFETKEKTLKKEVVDKSSHTPKKELKEDYNDIISEKKLRKAVEESNRIVFGEREKFEFRVHEKTGRFMVKLVDKETKETIREIPPEKILDLIANIWEMVGILVDERG